MRIRITVGDKKVTATLIDSDTARGKIEGDMEVFNQPGSIKATIELVK